MPAVEARDYRYLFAKYIPVAASRRVELVSPELAAELLASRKYELRAYVELGITSLAWICGYCGEVYLNETGQCGECAKWLFYGRSLRGYERAAVFSRWRNLCWYCGVKIEGVATVDHQQSRAQGGGHQPDNLVAACRRCNSQKGKRTVPEYREWLEARNGGPVSFFGESMN